MNLTEWCLKKKEAKKDLNLKKYKFSKLTDMVLKNRACEEKFKQFGIENSLFCSTLQSYKKLKDVKKAASRIKTAILNKENIAVFGDYDCDGICATAMLYTYFKSCGIDIIPYIPERKEGYGLSLAAIDLFKKKDVSLIITVDTGVVAFDEAKYIKSLGMDLIITDHHNALKELPEAFAIVDPKREDDKTDFKDISGAAVAFKLISAIEEKPDEEMLEKYSDLVAISTIADAMPLICENRIFVQKGLLKLKSTSSIGLKNLLSLSFKNLDRISAMDVAFLICPKLNAAGRLNNAFLAFSLLVETKEEVAKDLAIKILKYNLKRQQIEEQMVKEAVEEILKDDALREEKILIISKSNWEVGLIGLVAARIMHKFQKPTIVFSKQNQVLVGSARSFEGFSIYDAIKSVGEYCVKWGGHTLAGGLTLKEENYEIVKKTIFNFAKLNNPQIEKTYIDAEIKPSEINLNSIKNLQKLGPFGQYNNEPIFLITNVLLNRVIAIGQSKHLKLTFNYNGFYFDVLYFNVRPCEFYFKVNSKFNILVNIFVNSFRGVESVCYKMLDFRPFELKQKKLISDFKRFYSCVFEDLKLNVQNSELPVRKDFVYVYKILKNIKVFYGNIYYLYLVLFKNINFFKLQVVVEILKKKGILKEEYDGIYFKID